MIELYTITALFYTFSLWMILYLNHAQQRKILFQFLIGIAFSIVFISTCWIVFHIYPGPYPHIASNAQERYEMIVFLFTWLFAMLIVYLLTRKLLKQRIFPALSSNIGSAIITIFCFAQYMNMRNAIMNYFDLPIRKIGLFFL